MVIVVLFSSCTMRELYTSSPFINSVDEVFDIQIYSGTIARFRLYICFCPDAGKAVGNGSLWNPHGERW